MDLEYTHDGYNKFLDPDGYPAVEPPWGTLNAINLDTGNMPGEYHSGSFRNLAAKGLKNTGTENYGGPVATAGGLLLSARQTMTGSSARSTNSPASCFGRQRCQPPATRRQVFFK